MISESEIGRLLDTSRTIAVVGLSPKPERPSHSVARYLIAQGYEVIPVNPGQKEILSRACYARLADIPVPVDIVDCFRNAKDMLPIVDQAVAIGAKALWMQLGIENEEAAAKAEAAGLMVIEDRCIKIEHARRR